MKSVNTISFFALVMVLCFFFIAQPVLAEEAMIDEDNLNVRSGPGTDYDRVGQVNSGEAYEIIDEENEWVKIQLGEAEGWITKEFITIYDENVDTEGETEIETTLESVTIQQDNTHLREGASTDFDIIHFAEKNQTFDVLSETENWLEISNDDITGFVPRSFVEESLSNNRSNGLSNKTIVIDPGHGGRDVGAIGVSGSYEKNITYLTAQELVKELRSLGANVILTREDDEFIPLEARSTFANSADTDAFLSLHYNSFPEAPSASGIESFYYHDQYENLANFIHQGIIKETDERDRGVVFGDFHVVRQSFVPSVLLELGFLSNEENEDLLQRAVYQRKIVTGIVSGLQKYFAYPSH